MNYKEKAEELIRKYYTFGIRKEGQSLSWHESKQCALICVDEILETVKSVSSNEIEYDDNYWQQVKTEIEKL
jgi:hypothetical protein